MSDITLHKRPHHRSTIIGGRYAHTSASQVVEYRRCPRKWYYKKVCKIEEPGTPAQTRGKGIHAAIEQFLLTRELPAPDVRLSVREQALARALDEELPEPTYVDFVIVAAPFLPQDDYEVEREILLPTYPGGPLWVGYMDVRYPGRKIVDHKTTSDFRYCKTPEELISDVQMSTYAYWEFQQGATSPLEIVHLYLRTRGKVLANYVPALITSEQAEANWARDIATVREMSELVATLGVTEERPDEVVPNTESCGMYGGCFFRNRCGLGDFSIKSFVAAGALTRRRELAAQNVTTTETDVTYQTEGASTMNFEERLAAKAKSNGVVAHKPAPDRAPMPTTHTMPELPAPVMSLEERLKLVNHEMLPEDAPDREALPAPEPPVPPKRRETKKAAAAAVQSPELPLGGVAASEPERGMSDLDRVLEQERARVDAQRPLPPVDVAAAYGPAAGTVTSSGIKPQFTLYIDCFPIKGGHRNTYVLAEEFLQPLMVQVAEDHGVADFRLIPYGGGKAALAQAIRRKIEDVPEALVVGGYAAGSNEVLECLIPWASAVVRGK